MPASLTEALEDPDLRQAVVADSVIIIEQEVASKSGLRGMALKGGYKTVKKLRPGIIAHACNRLLPDFAPAVDPFWDRAKDSGQDVHAWFRSHSGEIADALLAVTDGHAARAKNRVMLKVYKSLRGHAREHVVAGVPRLSGLIDKHVG